MTGNNDHLRDEELDLWMAGTGDYADQPSSRVADHLDACRECSARLQALRGFEMTLRYSSPHRGDIQCPREEVWIDVAGGVLDDHAAAELLEHAATCTRCSSLLRDATAVISLDVAPEEARTLGKLGFDRFKPASPKAGPPLRRSLKARGADGWAFQRRIALAAAALVLFAAAAFLFTRFARADRAPEKLLARAYEKKRLTPIRVRGAHYVPSAVQRGRAPVPTGELPPELLQASAKAQSELEINHNSAYWHAIQGEVYLLEADPARAIQEYGLAIAYDPANSDFEFGLGTANCAAAMQGGKADEYSLGIEYLDRFLRKHPDDSVALYNSGLCLLRAGMLHQAKDRLQRAGAEERDPSWKRAIAKEIADLEIRLRQQSSSGQGRDSFPSHSSAASPLTRAIEANESGDPDRALLLAGQALRSAQQDHRTEDELNARYELTYALQRSSRAQECIQQANESLARPALRRYPEIRIRLVLELGICSNISGDFRDAARYLTEASSLAAKGHFLDIGYRSQGMMAGMLDSEGLHQQAEDLDVAALNEWLARPVNPMRAYQFLSDLFFNDVAQRRYFAANAVQREAIEYAMSTANVVIRSFAFEKLAETCIELDDDDCVHTSLARAVRERRSVAVGPAERFYESDWAIQQARLLLNHGRVQQAEELINSVAPEIAAKGFMEPLAYRSVAAELKAAKGDANGADRDANEAAEAIVRLRSTVPEDRERFAWVNDARPIFETLVAAAELHGDSSRAFYCWESYRTLLRKDSRPCDASIEPRMPPNATLVSFSRIGSRYHGWIVKSGDVRRFGELSDAREVDSLAAMFESLCARPDSRESDLRFVGNKLARALFGDAYEPLVSQPGALVIEADGGLLRLPFRALPTSDGQFLGIRKAMALIPGIWSLGSRSLRSPRYSSVEVLNASAGDPILAASDESTGLQFGSSLQQEIAVRNFADASRRLDGADFVYYSGHASEAEVAQVALSLPSRMRRCRYLVVAACSSGIGSAYASDVFELLPERLLQAGAWAVVASRWNVDSGRTGQLMQSFSRNLTAGMNLEVALQQASAELAGAGDRHPYYWAAFDVYGS